MDNEIQLAKDSNIVIKLRFYRNQHIISQLIFIYLQIFDSHYNFSKSVIWYFQTKILKLKKIFKQNFKRNQPPKLGPITAL